MTVLMIVIGLVIIFATVFMEWKYDRKNGLDTTP
jgi:hypothetical protein